MSCNGCRVLRKGCSAGCAIRSCLQCIRSPDSQANATVFLAKFYGRAGLLNLISSCPLHLRSSIFQSLLYEACGRVLDPVCGSVGLLWSGNWQFCQDAVEAVLKGAPITQMPVTLSGSGVSPLKTCDIRHVAKNPDRVGVAAKSRSRFKRSGSAHRKPEVELSDRTGIHPAGPSRESDRESDNKGGSVQSADGSHVSQAELIRAEPELGVEENCGVALNLSLSLLTAVQAKPPNRERVRLSRTAGPERTN